MPNNNQGQPQPSQSPPAQFDSEHTLRPDMPHTENEPHHMPPPLPEQSGDRSVTERQPRPIRAGKVAALAAAAALRTGAMLAGSHEPLLDLYPLQDKTEQAEENAYPSLHLSLDSLTTKQDLLEASPFKAEYESSRAILGNTPADFASPETGKEKPVEERPAYEARTATGTVAANYAEFVGSVTGTKTGTAVNFYKAHFDGSSYLDLAIDPRAVDVVLSKAYELINPDNGFIPASEVSRLQQEALTGAINNTITVIISGDKDRCIIDGQTAKFEEPGVQDCYAVGIQQSLRTEYEGDTNPLILVATYPNKHAGMYAEQTSSEKTLDVNSILVHEVLHAIVSDAHMSPEDRADHSADELYDQDGYTREHKLFVEPLTHQMETLLSAPGKMNLNQPLLDPALTSVEIVDKVKMTEEQIIAEINQKFDEMQETGELTNVVIYPNAYVEGFYSKGGLVMKLPGSMSGDKFKDMTEGYALVLDPDPYTHELNLRVIALGPNAYIQPDLPEHAVSHGKGGYDMSDVSPYIGNVRINLSENKSSVSIIDQQGREFAPVIASTK